MLHTFITANRDELIRRCRVQEAKRFAPATIPPEVLEGVPLFLRQLADTLRLEHSLPAGNTTAADPVPATVHSTAIQMGRTAASHGARLLHLGYTIDQVVHDYGDVCQTVTGMAVEQQAQIHNDEFRTLNRCLDDAMADAVTAYGSARQDEIDDQAATAQKRVQSFSDEHRRLTDIAAHAYAAIRTGHVGLTGPTGTLLVNALDELRSLPGRRLPGLASAMIPGTPTGIA